MVFFKNLLYFFKGNFKKFLTALFTIILLVLCFFLILSNSNSVSAETLIGNGSAFQEYECQNFQNYYEQNMASTYDYYCAVLRAGDSYAYINFFNASTDFNVRWTTENNGFVRSWPNTAISNGVWYSVQVRSLNDATYTYQGTFSGALSNWCTRIGTSPNYQYYFFGNIPLYDGANNLVWQPILNFPPEIINIDVTSYQQALVSGEFDAIRINGMSYTSCVFILKNEGNSLYDANEKIFILDEYSDYIFSHPELDPTIPYAWEIPKKHLAPFYNNTNYSMYIYYGDNLEYQTTPYNFTTDFSQATIDNNETDVQDSIIDMNEYLHDTKFDEGEFQLPTMAITENVSLYVNDLFNALYNIFTSDEYTDFSFEIPFSNGVTIDIPSNYIESKLPNVIIILVRIVYWYVICRFIIKDIMHIVNRLRQGDYLAGSDVNIKTEVL